MTMSTSRLARAGASDEWSSQWSWCLAAKFCRAAGTESTTAATRVPSISARAFRWKPAIMPQPTIAKPNWPSGDDMGCSLSRAGTLEDKFLAGTDLANFFDQFLTAFRVDQVT